MSEKTLDPKAVMNGGSDDYVKHPSFRIGPKWTAAGTWHGGRVVEPWSVYTVTTVDPRTKERVPKRYPPRDGVEGDEIKGVVVAVQTDQRDPEIPGDDGVRSIFVDGVIGKDDRKYDSLRRAVRDAYRKVGKDEIEQGGELFVGWTHQIDTGAPSPATNWVAVYKAPPSAAAAVMGGIPTQAVPMAPPPGSPTPAPAAAPAAPVPAPAPLAMDEPPF